MKSRLTLLFAALIGITVSVNSQTPQGFNYQAIARDVSGNPITGAALQIEIGILSDTILNTYVWIETHNVNTNQFGLFTLVVGQGTQSGGTAANFPSINWSAAPLFMRTRVYYQSMWRDMGAAKLWSVPYAMIADKALALTGNPVMINGGAVYIMNNVGIGTDTPGTTKLAVVGDDSQSSDALFEVKRKDGNVIFAVYNHGVRVNVPVDTLTKAKKGGFAVGGFDNTKGIVHDYMVISPDSIRLYFDNAPSTKAKKGGFAVGGFDETKGVTKAMEVNGESTKITVDNTGDFSVEERQSAANLIQLTPDNYFIGHESGAGITTGMYNTFFGYQAGKMNSAGGYNLFIGTESGKDNTTGYMNTFLGPYAGNSNIDGIANVFVGSSAGVSNESGGFNVLIGADAGLRNISGSSNVNIGVSAGYSNESGGDNILIGYRSGHKAKSSHNNVFLGYRSGEHAESIHNVYIGTEAGKGSSTVLSNGSYNVSLGYNSGHTITSGTSNVIIGNNSGKVLTSGNGNTFVGAGSGLTEISGHNNVFIGVNSGEGFTAGHNNVVIGAHGSTHVTNAGDNSIFIGAYAGQMESNSGRLYIEPSSADKNNALIYGEFDNDILRINGKLEVSKNLELAAGADRIIYQPDPTKSIFIGGHTSITSTYAMHFVTANALGKGEARMSILGTNGYVGVGTTSPQYRLDVLTDNSVGYAASIFNTGNSSTSHGIRLIAGSNSLSGSYLIRFHRTDGVEIGSIRQSSSTSVAYNTTSDERVKENITETSNGLEELLKIRVVDFNYKGDQISNRSTGFLAQQLYENYPVAVTKPAIESESWMVDYSRLTPILVKAIQEQQSIIEAKEMVIKNLEKRVSILEELMSRK